MWGSVREGYRAIDRRGTRRLTLEEFTSAMADLDMPNTKWIYQGIVHRVGVHVMTEDDIAFLDDWKPPEWLTATPDAREAERFKARGCYTPAYSEDHESHSSTDIGLA